MKTAPDSHLKPGVFDYVRRPLARLPHLLPLVVVTLLPVALNSKLWLKVCEGTRPRAWDGTGHYALAQIYDQTIFPDTFGWTHAYFAGMPFPNFYPPLFYWCVSLIHHTKLVSFATSFNLMVALPVLLLPVAVWLLAWKVSDKNPVAATCAALAITPILIDPRFHLIGLSYHSTFLIGLYTQPLGFVLLAAWYIIYLDSHNRRWRFAIACVLLALTVLANFFNAITATLFIAATIANDVVKLRSAKDQFERRERRGEFIAHLISPFVALCLTLFWLVPMVSQYDYFVTRPHAVALSEFAHPLMLGWYLLSVIGIVCWLRRPTRAMWPFLATCFALAGAGLLASTFAPRWFPLQAPRFVATLGFLLAVPVGQFMRAALSGLINPSGKMASLYKVITNDRTNQNVRPLLPALVVTCIGAALLVTIFVLMRKPSSNMAFYATDDSERIDGVLRFAEEHRDGRYLIEVPHVSYIAAAFDSRGLSSYLGAEGNDVVKVVFHEASPNSIFFNPLVNSLSAFQDNFGISSALADDLDFLEQPLARHLERARFVGVKYLVIVSPEIKNRLAREPDIKVVYDSKKDWTIFELQRQPMPPVRALAYRPALLVSSFSLKQRRRNEYNFIRLAEEQFSDGWFDVLLAHSPESRIDRVPELDQFGALILDTYECEDEDKAFERLREFARHRSLILLSSDAPLFRRVQAAPADFPLAEIIERTTEPPGEWIEAAAPSFRYGSSSIRKQWMVIRGILERRKIGLNPTVTVSGEIDQSIIQIKPDVPLVGESLPVLIKTTYHPSWRRKDGGAIYAVTPFFMLTFVCEPTGVIYERRWTERAGLAASASTLLLLCCLTGRRYFKRAKRLSAATTSR